MIKQAPKKMWLAAMCRGTVTDIKGHQHFGTALNSAKHYELCRRYIYFC